MWSVLLSRVGCAEEDFPNSINLTYNYSKLGYKDDRHKVYTHTHTHTVTSDVTYDSEASKCILKMLRNFYSISILYWFPRVT